MNPSININHDRAEELAAHLANRATEALLDEARLTPKPGLVDRRGSGAHKDMNLAMLETSAECLTPTFIAMAHAGWRRVPDAALRRQIGAIGREGEKTMLATTGGVNTHRGAIWSLGLLVTAFAMHEGQSGIVQTVSSAARLASLPDTACPPVFSKGRYASHRYKVPGAREEAQQGFPHVMKLALPQLAKSRREGASEDAARIDALLAIMTSLPDTCVLSRGGIKALTDMRSGARAILVQGGIGSHEGRKTYDILEAGMMKANVSPGGAADLLAATLFLDGMEHTAIGQGGKRNGTH